MTLFDVLDVELSHLLKETNKKKKLSEKHPVWPQFIQGKLGHMKNYPEMLTENDAENHGEHASESLQRWDYYWIYHDSNLHATEHSFIRIKCACFSI